MTRRRAALSLLSQGVSQHQAARYVYHTLEASSTRADAYSSQALASFLNQAFRGVNQNFNRELLERYRAVTKEDVLAVLRKYFLNLFDPSTSIAVVVTAPGKADETAEDLTKIGFEVSRRSLETDSDVDESGSESGSGSEDGTDSGSDR